MNKIHFIELYLDELYPELTQEEKERKLNNLGIKSSRQLKEEEIEKVAKLVEEFQTNYGFFRIGDINREDYYTYSKNLLNDGNDFEDIENILDILSMTYKYESDYEEPIYINLKETLKDFKVIRKEN